MTCDSRRADQVGTRATSLFYTFHPEVLDRRMMHLGSGQRADYPLCSIFYYFIAKVREARLSPNDL